MKENIKMRYPLCIKSFKCIGGECEDTCCGGWEIHIDKNTYQQYRNIQNKKMNKFINKNIFIRNNCNNSDVDYGQIKLKYDKCPFLSKDQYCIIHSELGQGYLSNVCTIFPRVINKIDDFYEMSLNVSCLEAAKVLLLKEDGIEFEERDNNLEKHVLMVDIDTTSKEISDTNYKYLKEIRDMSIKIIKNREYGLIDRLYILWYFLGDLQKELLYNYNNVKGFIEEYNINHFGKGFKRDKANYLFQISFYRDMLEKLDISESGSNYFELKIKELKLGFRLNEGKSLIENSELYLKAYDECEDNAIKKYSYIFENYLVNHMFKELFPFSENDVIIDGYIMMLIRFSYLRFYIVGQYLYDGGISKKNILKSIQSLTKGIEHDKNYLKDILRYIKENELDNKRFIEILL